MGWPHTCRGPLAPDTSPADEWSLTVGGGGERQVNPAGPRIILATDVVVALLLARESIAEASRHRHSLQEQQCGKHISHLPPGAMRELPCPTPQFHERLPEMAVAVIFAVCTVVFFIVKCLYVSHRYRERTHRRDVRLSARRPVRVCASSQAGAAHGAGCTRRSVDNFRIPHKPRGQMRSFAR
jgi:hypothetical protein